MAGENNPSITQEAILRDKYGVENPRQCPYLGPEVSRFVHSGELMKDFYLSAGSLIKRIMESAVVLHVQFPPFGFVDDGQPIVQIPQEEAFGHIAYELIKTMEASTMAVLVELEGTRQTEAIAPLNANFERYITIIESLDPSTEPFENLMNGFGNAVLFFRDINYVICQLAPDESVKQRAQIAQNSYSLVAKARKLEIDQFVVLLKKWRKGKQPSCPFDAYCDPEFFKLVETPQGKALDVKNPDDLIPSDDVLVCPAGINYDQSGSAIRKLFNWYSAIVLSAAV